MATGKQWEEHFKKLDIVKVEKIRDCLCELLKDEMFLANYRYDFTSLMYYCNDELMTRS